MTFEGQQLQGAVKIMEKLQVDFRIVAFFDEIHFFFFFQI